MSHHKTRKQERKVSPEMKAAHSRNLAYEIKTATEFEREWGVMNNSDLASAAHEMEMLGFKLRHMLWLRHHRQHQAN
jgi:hypothetical protein